MGQRLSIHRRGDAGPDLGLQTFWFGFQFREGDDRPDASALANEMRTRWLGGTGGYTAGDKPVWFDRPVDPLVQAMDFAAAADGSPVGSIVRFCAHPHLTSACRERLRDPDFPGRTRSHVEARAGGAPCMFLLGPSANLVPKEKVRYVLDEARSYPRHYLGPTSLLFPETDDELLAETDRIGREIAEAALSALDAEPRKPLERVTAAAASFPLPLDPQLPVAPDEAARMKAVLAEEHDAFLRQGSPPRELRRLVNTMNWVEWAAAKAPILLTAADLERGSVNLSFTGFAVNDAVIALLPSELPMEATAALHAAHPGLDLWTVSLCNGSVEYVPTAEMRDEGGYEGRSTVVAREAEETLRRHASQVIGQTVCAEA